MNLEARIDKELEQRKLNCIRGGAMYRYAYQVIGNITVIRDDQLCGGTKSRILDLVPDGYDIYVYISNPYGGAGLALTTKFGSKVRVFVKEPILGPLARMAVLLGAKYIYYTHESEIDTYLANLGSVFIIPNGIELPGVIERFKLIGDDVAVGLGQFDVAFIPCGSGTLVRGLSQSSLAKHYIAICVAGGCSPTGSAECIQHHLPVSEPATIMPPYLSTMFYDAKVWEYAYTYSQTHPEAKVLIWNVL